ncbi:CGNR zinc finger domain-containing protein [Kitasatospora sp. NPDC127111]|uniref:CGNR zinc finger domain-containing protein n=1 Tax=Kitasatospora sp. NPDC127111 TaxID=3345363 RepID=UPI0036403496
MLEPPAAAVLVEAFANTVDVELASDEIADPEGLAAWLTGRGLLAAPDEPPGGTPDEAPGEAPDETAGKRPGRAPGGIPARIPAEVHAGYLALRAGIREELGAHVGDTPDPELLAAADRVLAGHPVLITAGGALVPAPGLSPERGPLAALAIAWSGLVATGDAARLKRCAEHTCGWAFWDMSKNRSRRWCSMRVCGNRNKSRSYASRQRGPA